MEEFQRHINPYECFWWPLTMMKRFTSFPRILSHIHGWEQDDSFRILVLRGEHDRLMTRPVMHQLADAFRQSYGVLVSEKKTDAGEVVSSGLLAPDGEDAQALGVRSSVVPGAGHHMQNDIGWEVGAQKLLDWYQQL